MLYLLLTLDYLIHRYLRSWMSIRAIKLFLIILLCNFSPTRKISVIGNIGNEMTTDAYRIEAKGQPL